MGDWVDGCGRFIGDGRDVFVSHTRTGLASTQIMIRIGVCDGSIVERSGILLFGGNVMGLAIEKNYPIDPILQDLQNRGRIQMSGEI